MKILRGIALGLVSFFLFIVLLLLGFAIALNVSLLNPQFMVDEIEKLDINSTVQQILSEQLSPEYQPYLSELDKTLVRIKPWIDQQIKNVIFQSYDYLLDKTGKLEILISSEPIKTILATDMTEIYVQTLPQEFQKLPPDQKAQQIASIQQQIEEIIPSTIVINRDLLGAEWMQNLTRAKEIIGYIRTLYFILIAVTFALFLLLFLILRDRKWIVRALGIIFAIAGVLETIIFFIMKQLIPASIPLNNIPDAIQIWLRQLINDLTFPGGIFGVSLLTVGIILIIVSFLFRAKQPAAMTLTT